ILHPLHASSPYTTTAPPPLLSLSLHDALPISAFLLNRHPPNCMFSCLQILEAFLWFVLITLLNVTLIILTLSVSRLLNLLLRLKIGRAVQQECRDRYRMPSSA